VARIRTVKPQFFEHVELGRLPFAARLLAIGLLQLADGHGRMRWTPKKIEAHVFPFDQGIDLDALASGLESAGWLVRYEVDGRPFAEIPNFRKHQRITGKEASYESEIPERNQACSRGNIGEASGAPSVKQPDAQEEGIRSKEGEGETRERHHQPRLGDPVVADDDGTRARKLLSRFLPKNRVPSYDNECRALTIVQGCSAADLALAVKACSAAQMGWTAVSMCFDDDGALVADQLPKHGRRRAPSNGDGASEHTVEDFRLQGAHPWPSDPLLASLLTWRGYEEALWPREGTSPQRLALDEVEAAVAAGVTDKAGFFAWVDARVAS
jgi:hypothetical protein